MPAALVDAAKTRDQALRCMMHREAEPSDNVVHAEVSATVESAGDSVQTRAPAEDADKDADLGQAVEESTREAVERENADVADAIVRSKADAPQWLTPDGVVLLRLTRHAKAVEVATALTSAPELEHCRALVYEAGCEIQPEWAGGAWLLVPCTREQFHEVGLTTSAVHILALSRDEEAVRRALQRLPKEKRPKLRPEILGNAVPMAEVGRPDAGLEPQMRGRRSRLGRGMGP